mgnify:CR=1 FL=1
MVLDKKKSKLIAATLLLTLVSLAGCGSASEPNELGYVQFIGVDEGKDNLLEVTFLIAIPKNLAGEGGGKGEGAFVTTISAPTIFAALNMVNTYVGRRLSFIHVKGVIFSDKLARKGKLTELLPSLLQFRETRGTAFIAITENKLRELMKKFTPFLEANPSRYMELLTRNYLYTGFIANSKLQNIYTEMKVDGLDSVITLIDISPEKLPEGEEVGHYKSEGSYQSGQIPKKGGVEIQAIGGAILNEGIMVGTLNGDETIIFNMVRGQFRSAFFSLPDPQKKEAIMNLEVFVARPPKIKVSLTEEGPLINLRIALEGNVLGGGTTIDYALSQRRVILEQAFEKKIKRLVEQVAEKSLNYGSDFLGFGLKARHQVRTLQEWNDLDWGSLYPQSQVNVEVDFKIRRTSTLFKHAPIIKKGVQEGES